MYDSIYELEHFGVPGMRWGVRKSRVSASSGTQKKKLTPEQREKRAALKKRAVKVAKGAAVAAGVAAGTMVGGYAVSPMLRSGGYAVASLISNPYRAKIVRDGANIVADVLTWKIPQSKLTSALAEKNKIKAMRRLALAKNIANLTIPDIDTLFVSNFYKNS